MKFITNIPKEKFNKFVSAHSKSHFLQSYDWGIFKSATPTWTFDTVGLEENGNLVAAALVLSRTLPVIKRPFLYIPRGFVLDFGNAELLQAFTKHMHEYAKKKGAIFFKIDPDIKYVSRDVDGNLVEGEQHRELVENLKKMGYKHLGLTQDFDSTIQPRYTFRLDITNEEKELLSGCHSKTRYNIKIAQKKGIEIFEGSRDDLATFESIMRVTGERDGFLARGLDYFEKMYDTLAPSGMCKLYLAKLNTKWAVDHEKQEQSDVEKTLSRLETELENPDLTEKRSKKLTNQLDVQRNKLKKSVASLQELKKIAKEHPDGVIMSGIITTYFGNKAWYLYGASDNLYREFMPNYLIQWHALSEAKAAGYEIYDFFGISGRTDEEDPLHGLYRFKKGFGGEFTEFIGEFDYVANSGLYFVWATLLPQFKKYKKLLKRKK